MTKEVLTSILTKACMEHYRDKHVETYRLMTCNTENTASSTLDLLGITTIYSD